MWQATLYIIACSGKNRMRRRLARLREPRYLLGALAGSAYLYFSMVRRLWTGGEALHGTGDAAREAFLPVLGGTGPVLAGMALLGAAGVGLLLPLRSGLLQFSKAEREFLFAAPVTARQLLSYRFLRSQRAPLLTAIILALTLPLASPLARLMGLAGVWIVLAACQGAFAGVSLTRGRTHVPALRARCVVWVPRLAVLGSIAVIAAETGQVVAVRVVDTADAALKVLVAVCSSGWSRVAVWPFIALVRPLFAESGEAFAQAVPAALAVAGLVVAWVFLAAEAFDGLSEDRVDEAAGQTTGRTNVHRERPAAWTLALEGRPEMTFAWKAATQTVRIIDRRHLLTLLLSIAWITAVVAVTGRAVGFIEAAGLVAAAGAGLAVFLGPQIVRLDLRYDLRNLDLLKTWPVRAAAIVRGEMLWPVIVVTSVAWALGACAVVLWSAGAFEPASVAWALAASGAAMIVAPALVLAQYTIHTAAALVFPAWILVGPSRGLDSMGQRLIVLGGTLVALTFAVGPAGFVGGLLWAALSPFIGPWVLIPAAVAAVAIVSAEVWLATEALGPVYDRLDLTSVERVE